MKYTAELTEAAPDGQLFAADAFAKQVGQTVPLTVNGKQVGTSTVVSVAVAPDGRSVAVRLDNELTMAGGLRALLGASPAMRCDGIDANRLVNLRELDDDKAYDIADDERRDYWLDRRAR